MHSMDTPDLVSAVKSVSSEARKLLAQVAELAYSGKHPERETDTAYLPEILESSGLDVDRMYALFAELQRAGLLAVVEQYPFEHAQLLTGDMLRQLRDKQGISFLEAIGSLVEVPT